MKKRKDISAQYKWNLSDYFASDEKWQEMYEQYCNEIPKVKDFDNNLTSKQNILNCFKLLENLDKMAEPLYIYAHCNKDVDVTNAKSQEMLSLIENKLTQQSVLSSFVSPQLAKLNNEFLNSLISDPQFAPYSKILKDVIREKQHTLSEENESLLSNVSSFSRSFSLNFSNFENGDLKFNKVKNKQGKELPMDQSLASLYLRESDEVLRQNAYLELHSAFGRYNNFLSSNYLGSVKKDVFYATSRKFANSLESALFYEDVDSSVYNMLLSQVNNNLDLEHKYFLLKQKLLGLKQFKLSDVYYNPFKSKKKYAYEQGLDLVCKALSVLGEDYVSSLRQMDENRKIDVFPNQYKRSGAYETGAYGKSPVVLTNFTGNYDDVSTLAHELGHAMHTVYSNKNQSMYNAGYTIFLAEIASTVNETILNYYMLNNTQDKNEKVFYINEFLSRFHATVFRQTMFATFESAVHEMVEQNKPVSNEILNNKYLDLVKHYFGKKVKILDCVKYEWSRIPHFYTAFYVYKYATGLISAINIVENILDGTISVDDYKKFLSSGCTQDPVSLLKIVKVDLSTDEPFKKAFNVVNKYLNNLKQLIK